MLDGLLLKERCVIPPSPSVWNKAPKSWRWQCSSSEEIFVCRVKLLFISSFSVIKVSKKTGCTTFSLFFVKCKASLTINLLRWLKQLFSEPQAELSDCSRENAGYVLRIALSIWLKIIADEGYRATVSQSKTYAFAHKTETEAWYVSTRLVEKQLIQASELSLSSVCWHSCRLQEYTQTK